MNDKKLVMMLRVKDGILFINEWLQNMENLVDEIVVVDNGSTDGTLEILQQHSKVVNIAQTEGFNEGKDKIILYKLARKRNPAWCIWLDVDEIFEKRVTRAYFEKMMKSKFVKEWRFRRFAMRKNQSYFQGNWGDLLETCKPTRNMWKEQSNAFFSGDFIHGGGIHGLKGMFWHTNLRIKHLAASPVGYREYRIQKYKEAKDLDSNEVRQKMYDQNLALELNDDVPMWRWYEYSERPVWVSLQNYFLTLLMFYRYAKVIPKKIIRKLKK